MRIFVLHHVTYSINSICHVFGRRRFRPPTSRATCSGWRRSSFGESWHNNHHAFPTSARHGLGRWQFDPSALVIRGLEACGLAWDVVRVAPSASARPRCRAKRAYDVDGGGPRARPSSAPPWQFLVRAVAVVTGLTLLLIVDVRGAAFYVAWALIVLALTTEGVATLVYWRRSRGDRGA